MAQIRFGHEIYIRQLKFYRTKPDHLKVWSHNGPSVLFLYSRNFISNILSLFTKKQSEIQTVKIQSRLAAHVFTGTNIKKYNFTKHRLLETTRSFPILSLDRNLVSRYPAIFLELWTGRIAVCRSKAPLQEIFFWQHKLWETSRKLRLTP